MSAYVIQNLGLNYLTHFRLNGQSTLISESNNFSMTLNPARSTLHKSGWRVIMPDPKASTERTTRFRVHDQIALLSIIPSEAIEKINQPNEALLSIVIDMYQKGLFTIHEHTDPIWDKIAWNLGEKRGSRDKLSLLTPRSGLDKDDPTRIRFFRAYSDNILRELHRLMCGKDLKYREDRKKIDAAIKQGTLLCVSYMSIGVAGALAARGSKSFLRLAVLRSRHRECEKCCAV